MGVQKRRGVGFGGGLRACTHHELQQEENAKHKMRQHFIASLNRSGKTRFSLFIWELISFPPQLSGITPHCVRTYAILSVGDDAIVGRHLGSSSY